MQNHPLLPASSELSCPSACVPARLKQGSCFPQVTDQVRVEVIGRQGKGFESLPHRWIVERTLGWLNRYRRLGKDYELYPEMSEAMIYGSMISLMVKRLAA